jgi:chromate transporter
MTPGPVLSAVTFIGYLVQGIPGAAVSTLAVFLPSFIIVAVTGPWIPHLRSSAPVRAFLKGVNSAVVALILAIGIRLFGSVITDAWAVLILVVSFGTLLSQRVDTAWLVLGGAAIGLLRHLVFPK